MQSKSLPPQKLPPLSRETDDVHLLMNHHRISSPHDRDPATTVCAGRLGVTLNLTYAGGLRVLGCDAVRIDLL